jgi:hypothetical protein
MAMAYPSNRPKVAVARPRDTQPTRPRPLPANDNPKPRIPRIPANDNLPKPGRLNLNPLPRSRESFPHLRGRALRLLGLEDIGSALLIGAIEWAGYAGGAQVWRVGNNWTLHHTCPKTGAYQWNSSGGLICLTRQSGLAGSMKQSPDEVLVAVPAATGLTQWTNPYPHPSNPAVSVWDTVQMFQRVSGQPALPAPRMVNVWSPAPQPLELPFHKPWLIPTVDPLEWPIGVPYMPVPVPWPMIPHLPQIDPNRDPLEQPRRGPRPTPRPRPSPYPSPGPRPDGQPVSRPVPVEPPAPGNLPSIDIGIEPGKLPSVNSNGQHARRPPRKGEKEKKGGANHGLYAALSSPGGILAIAGAITEANDMLKALYESLPVRVRRWKGRDGKWRNTAITPQDMVKELYKHADQIDIDKFQMNFLKNEIGDAVLGIASKSKGGREGLGGFGGYHAGPAL